MSTAQTALAEVTATPRLSLIRQYEGRARRWAKVGAGVVRGQWAKVRPHLGRMASLSSITVAGFTISLTIGFVVMAGAFLLLEDKVKT